LFLGQLAGFLRVQFVKPGICQRREFVFAEFFVSVLVALRNHLWSHHHARPETTATASAAGSAAAFGRHGRFIVDLGDCDDQQTLFAFAGRENLSVLAAFENGIKTVETQIAAMPFFAVAAKARRLEKRANVFRVSQSFLSRGRGQLTEIRFSGSRRPTDGERAHHYERGGILHFIYFIFGGECDD
jgi:hypothetical protein